MEVASPPKRMTRARAAKKDTPSSSSSAATKAAATKRATAPTASTAAKATTARTSIKRKARDETEEDVQRLREEGEDENTMNKPASRGRGRAKKVTVDSTTEQTPQSQSQLASQVDDASATNTTATKGTRGRKKATTTTTTTATSTTKTTAASSTSTKAEPALATRTRTTRKAATPTTSTSTTKSSTEPAKKGTRGRTPKAATGIITTTVSTEPTPGLKSAVSRPTGRIAGVVKKTVTFQEPEKENMVPASTTGAKSKTKTTESTATGMRAKPVRKAATAGRATRASARAASPEEKKEKSPLSPKKDGQNLPITRDASSDDELATYEKTPLPRLKKSPVKPPASTRRVDLQPPPKEEDEDLEEPSEPAAPSVLGSPARRPPPSPWKDSMKSPAKKIDTVPAFIFSSTQNDNQQANTPFKPSILQSPAKRPQLPIAAFQLPPQETNLNRSPVKMSLFQSPAKRPVSPIKMLGSSSRDGKNDPKPELDFEQVFGSKPSPERVSPAEKTSQEETLVPEVNEEVEDEAAIDADSEEEAGEEPEEEDENEEEEGEQEEEQQQEVPVLDQEQEQKQEHEHQSLEPEEKYEEEEKGEEVQQPAQQQSAIESPAQLEFPGRLSAVLPRHADPVLKDTPVSGETSPIEQEMPAVVESTEPQANLVDAAEDHDSEPMELDEAETKEAGEEVIAESAASTTPPHSPPPSVTNPTFKLREKELEDQYMSESEDELALSAKMSSKYEDDATLTAVMATPTPSALKNPRAGLPSSAIKAASRAIRSISRTSNMGFTPLAVKLGDWKASSPMKQVKMEPKMEPQPQSPAESTDDSLSLIEDTPEGSSPSKGFFADEMRIRAEMETQAAIEAALEADIAAKYDDPGFGDLDITHEDVELAAEAHEMSLMDTDPVEEMADARAHDDSISDASQEYGDENAVPIDPALAGTREGARSLSFAPETPVRPSVPRGFATVSKVPLKPADDSTPRTLRRRSLGPSRSSMRRSSGLSRNTTVTSYVPIKDSSDMDLDDANGSEHPPVTPAKSDIWEAMGTPARTPRRDINSSLLRGAVVFVDVHTSEGSDASVIFVDLLTQMGARCVKSWPWNPTNAPNGELNASKIGITHVVYKDGGKRTLEKVRESGGVVQCVGVSWVLDCERENEWVDEGPYLVDTSLVPRGGRNRRKSMEPKALANVNGTLVTPMKPNAASMRDCQTVPNNHMGRRDSTAWVRSPSDRDDEEDAPADQDWANDTILTPVPKTPAPETVARFALDVTPGGIDEDDDMEDSPEKQQLLMRTCPPKKATFATDLGPGLLRQDKDQSVMMRLMAARRKSLQFAPKVASPLSKTWR
ncbi:hypothetical protein F4810DRAFT_649993 [Camillea tinctor]|nr:hypothetical protein F4810DRAFT_649993 [Camillea tinctor]